MNWINDFAEKWLDAAGEGVCMCLLGLLYILYYGILFPIIMIISAPFVLINKLEKILRRGE